MYSHTHLVQISLKNHKLSRDLSNGIYRITLNGLTVHSSQSLKAVIVSLHNDFLDANPNLNKDIPVNVSESTIKDYNRLDTLLSDGWVLSYREGNYGTYYFSKGAESPVYYGYMEGLLNEAYDLKFVKLPEARELWKQLEEVPVDYPSDDSDELAIDVPFLHFDAGTNTMDIWHYFESQYNLSVGLDLI